MEVWMLNCLNTFRIDFRKTCSDAKSVKRTTKLFELHPQVDTKMLGKHQTCWRIHVSGSLDTSGIKSVEQEYFNRKTVRSLAGISFQLVCKITVRIIYVIKADELWFLEIFGFSLPRENPKSYVSTKSIHLAKVKFIISVWTTRTECYLKQYYFYFKKFNRTDLYFFDRQNW